MSVFLVQSKEEPTLAEVVAAADATNHAIPTPNELSQAFTKLINAGVLKVNCNNYKISSDYLSEIEKAYKSKGGLFESANKGKKWLNKSGLEVIKTPKITIKQDDVKIAYDAYTSNIEKNG